MAGHTDLLPVKAFPGSSLIWTRILNFRHRMTPACLHGA